MVVARPRRLPEQADVHAPEATATAADLLAVLQRLPARPMTERERALLAEVDDEPVRWLSHEELVGGLGARDDR